MSDTLRIIYKMCEAKVIKMCVVLMCVCNLSRCVEIPANIRGELGEMICPTKTCARYRSQDNKIICDSTDDFENDWNMSHIIPLTPPSIHCKEESFIAIKTSNASLKYLMEIKSEKNSTWKLLYKGNLSLKIIEDLDYHTKFKLRLWGVSMDGYLMGPSETDWLQTLASQSKPQEVESIQLKELVVWNNYQAVITWRPPETKSCYYELVWFSGHDYEHGQIDITNVTGNFEATIRNLAYDSDYSVAIVTKSSDWTKESSKTWLHFKTEQCWDIQSNLSVCLPATPENVSIELIKPSENEPHLYNVVVNWNAPSFLPDYYTVELTLYYSVHNSNHFLLKPNGNSTSTTFARVELGLHHQITVTAWSVAGSSRSIIINQESPELKKFQHYDTNKRLKLFSFTTMLSIVMIIFFVFLLLLLCVQRSKKTDQSFQDIQMVESCNLTSHEEACNDFKDSDQWELDPNNIHLLSKLGEGAFGLVRKAKLIHGTTEIYVAVKMLKDHSTVEDVRQFKKEIEIMKTVGFHPNIVSIIGCCTVHGYRNIKLVVEYCPGGNLLNYLRRFSNIAFIEPEDSIDYKYSLFEEIQTDSSDISSGLNFANIAYLIEGKDSVELQLKDMLSMARQIANGMEYLASLRMVHRDLAARNVLVCEDNVVKVSDFGLSRDVYNDNVYVKLGVGKVPVRWMALESLTHQRYTTKSDVWSFGILLWEIFTMGGNPYPNFSDTLNLLDSLKAGHRMGCPRNCNNQIYDLMLNCWKKNPIDRPTFTEIRKLLDILLEGLVSYVNVDPLPSREKNVDTENSNASDWYVRPL